MPIKFKKIRVRFAPSPTGPFHIGTARTALFNYLFAKKYKGSFILRIEDTDLRRSNPKYEKDIKDELQWLGIKWDEFYRQSERIDSYTKYLKKSLESGQAFYCGHSKEELEKERKEKLKKKELPIHICEHYNKKLKNGIIRFRPPKKKIVFNDLIRSKVEFDSELLGDISIAKNLKTPLYNFAVVIDDYEMKISHVIRGEDHLSNTPKQILIQEALKLPSPQYAHLPLILGPDKTKLSKRHGVVSVADYQKQGYLPEALINFMALLGWSPQDGILPQKSKNHLDEEIFSVKELIKKFSLEKIQKGGATFNVAKLDWFNGNYIRQKSLENLTLLCLPYLVERGLINPIFINKQYPPAYGGYSLEQKYIIAKTKKDVPVNKLKKIIGLEQKRMKKLSEAGELTEFFFEKPRYKPNLLKWPRAQRARLKEKERKEIIHILNKLEQILSEIKEKDFKIENLKTVLMPEAEKFKDRGYLLWPLRAALTGREKSPGPFEIAEILGKEKVLERIKEAKRII